MKKESKYVLIIMPIKEELTTNQLIELASIYDRGDNLQDYISQNYLRFCSSKGFAVNAKIAKVGCCASFQADKTKVSVVMTVGEFTELGYYATLIKNAEVTNNLSVTILDDIRDRYQDLQKRLDEYIKEVYNNSEYIKSYIRETMEQDPNISFRRVLKYNAQTKDYDRYILPIRDEKQLAREKLPEAYNYFVSNGIVPYCSRYSCPYIRGNIDPKIYTVGQKIPIKDLNFESLAQIYELLFNQHITDELNNRISGVMARTRRQS